MKVYRAVCVACLVMAYLVVTAGATVRASGSGMGCPDWPKCFGHLIPPTNQEQVTWGPGKSFAKGTMIIHPLSENGETVDRLLVAKEDLVTGEAFIRGQWDTFDRHDYATFNALHTWTEFVNRILGALIAVPVLLLVGTGAAIAVRKQGLKPLIWSLVVMVQLGVVGLLGREVVLGNLTPNSITIHMLAAWALIALMFVCLNLGRDIRRWPSRLGPLLLVCWLVIILQIAVGTQVRESVDLLNRQGVPRAEWSAALPVIFTWHKALSWAVTLVVACWFILSWRSRVVGTVTWMCLGLLAIQALSGYLFVLTGFAAILQPIHLVAAMLLAGLIWWSLIRGPRMVTRQMSRD